MLPAASWIVAVSTRVAPGGQVRGRAGECDLGRGAVHDVEGAEGAGGEPGGGGFHRHGAGEGAGDRLGGDAVAAVALPVPLTVPAPEACAKATTVVLSEVTVLPAASSIVAVSTPRRAGVEVGGRAGEDDVGGCAVDDVERAERAGREPGGGGFHRDRAGEGAGDRLRRDAGGGGRVAGAADGADPGLLGEGDHGRVVGGDGVAGGVLDRRGQHAASRRRSGPRSSR